jgi:hypothetical protein
MLEKIFNTFKSKEELQRPLVRYVIVTCFPKMWARIKHSRSLFYSEVLGSIQSRGSSFITSKQPLAPLETSNNEGFTQPKPVDFAPSKEPATGMNRDDIDFLKTLVKHEDFPKIKFPALHERLRMQNQKLRLYDEETCWEFCLAVNLVLKGFREGLDELVSHRGTLDKRPPKKTESEASIDASRYGYMLYLLSKSAALRMYLQNVDPLLSDFHQPPPKRVYWFKEKPTDVLDEDEEREEGVELDAGLGTDNEDFVFPTEPDERFTGKDAPAWQICLRWIKLLASHFRALNILVGHITYFPDISVRLLQNSPGQDTLLRWDTLLKNPKYFPEHTLSLGHSHRRRNEEIISFLKSVISCQPYKLGYKIQNFRDEWEEIMKGTVTEKKRLRIAKVYNTRFLEIQETIGIPACVTHAQDIRNLLERWKAEESQGISISSSLILSKIESMMELCYVFSQFATPGIFKGTVHCEANLANFLSHPNRQKLEDLKVGYLVHVFVSVI